MRCFSISSSRKFTSVGSASTIARFRPASFSSVEKYGEKKNTRQVAVLLERVGELRQLVADAVELAVLLGDLEQRLASRRGRSPPRATCASPSRAPSAEKSSSPSASWTSRRWSSGVSVLRVTFSVASTVRSATSLRISWIARRVSASMSRRVCSSSSSRWRRAASSDSRSCSSAALRARATISSACWRASCSRSRYSCEQLVGLGLRALGRVDRLLDRLLALVERLLDPRERELRRNHSVTPKAISVQIISPSSGVTRKLPPSSAVGAPPLALRLRPGRAM